MNIEQQTNNVASQGRYGDTMLMHVNPAEVQGLASLMPLTRNPQTGQPEAFLPFLLPLLGSALGTAGLTGAGAGALGGLIGATGLSSAAAGAIGSAATTALVEGDLKKGIMSGITGFGLGKVMGAAGTAGTETLATDATQNAIEAAGSSNALTAAAKGDIAGGAIRNAAEAGFSGDVAGTLGLNSSNVQEALNSGLTSQADLMAQVNAGNANFIEPGMAGFQDRLGAMGKGAFSKDTMSAISNPSGYLPIALGEGQKGVIESQENFERQMAQMEKDREESRANMFANNPENIPMSSRYYSANGGILSLANGGETDLDKKRTVQLLQPPKDRMPPPPIQPPQANNSFEAAMSGSQDYKYMPQPDTRPVIDSYQKMQTNALTGEETPTGQYVPPSNYRAGIDPEFNYFPDSNRPATYLGDYLGNTGGPSYDFSGITAGLTGKGGSQGLSNIIKPNVQGIKSDAFNENMPQIDTRNFNLNSFNPKMLNIPNMGEGITSIGKQFNERDPMIAPKPIPKMINENPIMSPGGNPNFDERGLTFNPKQMPISIGRNDEVGRPPQVSGGFMPQPTPQMPIEAPMPAPQMPIEAPMLPPQMPIEAPMLPPQMPAPEPMPRQIPRQIPSSFERIDEREDQIISRMPNENSVPFVPPVTSLESPTPLTLRDDFGLSAIQPPKVSSGFMPQPATDFQINLPVTPPQIMQPTTPTSPEIDEIISRMPRNRGRGRMPMRMAEGKQLPNEGLEALNSIAPEVVDRMGYQEGGMTPSNEEIQQVATAITGENSNADSVINMFIEKYGNEVFMQIREMILNPQGQAQTQGIIEGQGGGMDDQVMGMIGNQRPVAVSPGEYIVPADVVSGLGDGSSDSGAKELDGMLDRVREERTNTTKQPAQLNAGRVLPR